MNDFKVGDRVRVYKGFGCGCQLCHSLHDEPSVVKKIENNIITIIHKNLKYTIQRENLELAPTIKKTKVIGNQNV